MVAFTPVKIGALVVKNRLVMPPMHTGKSVGGHVTEEMVRYYGKRALFSSPGIILTEHSFITSGGMASETQLSIASDELIDDHIRLTDAIHEGGSLAFVQLNHAGSNGIGDCVSASEIFNPRSERKRRPRALPAEEIRSLEKAYATAAGRAVKAGYDGVEIHSAHGYLLNQFYSPLTNERTDMFGGSLENRLRFLLETVREVRAVTGDDVPLAVRLGGCDYLSGGATEEDAVNASLLLEKAGVDLLDISGGMCGFIVKGLSGPGYFSSMTEKIKKAVRIPVLLTGGVTTAAEAEKLLKEGKADLIGIGRALMKDARCLEADPNG
ncbi:MAG: NADH:flavin oxidoreductase [Oscillospiraceae bacterium]|nr:NADH:flavin oxidoreductase [Oscillospiraceae bacterium]